MMAKHRAKKMFGQNFLTDTNIIEKIIRHLQVKEGQNLIEIGPGLGAITKPVLEAAKRLCVIEVDDNLVQRFKEREQTFAGIKIVHQDVLTVNFKTLSDEFANGQKIRIFGNLPYNISTPLLFHLYQYIDSLQDMVFMLQKEVVDRLCAKANTKEYGRLTVMSQFYCHAEYLFTVSPQCFSPAPKVYSAIVKLTPKPANERFVCQPGLLEEVVKEAFNYRRKTVANALKRWLQAEHWAKIAIDANNRPENLTLEDFVTITNFIDNHC